MLTYQAQSGIYNTLLAYRISPLPPRHDSLEAVVITQHANPGESSHQNSLAHDSPKSSIALAKSESILKLEDVSRALFKRS